MIFLSYARADGRDHAEQLEADLNAAGLTTWRDKRNLNEYNDFSAEIEINIREATFVAIVVTPSVEQNPSSFVRREILYAQSKNKPIIPLIFANATPPILINHLTYIEFHEYAVGFAELLERLKKSPSPSPQPQTDDPFRPYLRNLYDWIVSYLEKTVFALITLRAEATPDAVSSLLPMTFLDTFSAMAGVKTEKTAYNNFNEAFEKYEGRVLLLGEPGAGKTTTLMAFAREMVTKRLENPALPLPILAPIVTWDAEKQTPLADWLSNGYPNFKDELTRQIQQGKALLLLDGLDELGRERENPQTKERYDPGLRFLNIIPTNNQLLISCRIKDYEEIGQKLNLNGAVTLQPLDDSQMQDYLRYLPGLWQALEKDAELRQVARTPLLLSLFALAFQNVPFAHNMLSILRGGDLRDKIFETYVAQRYAHEARKLNAEVAFSLNELKLLLGELATEELFKIPPESIRFTFQDQNLIGRLGELKAKTFLDLSSTLHLIVIEENDRLRFIHLLLRDYFAYQYLIPLAEKPALSYRDQIVRRRAVSALERLRDPRAVDLLLELLQDGNGDIRERAASSLRLFHDPRILNHLLPLLEDGNPNVRRSAIASLGRQRAEIPLKLIINALNDPVARVRSVAASVSGQQRHTPSIEVIDTLIDLLKDNDGEVRGRAARALGKLGSPKAVIPLSKLLEDTALTRSRFPFGKRSSREERLKTYIERVCDTACWALEQFKVPEAEYIAQSWLMSELANMNEARGTTGVRFCDIAANKLERFGTPEALEAVRKWREQQANS